jgi:hypothetical protein
MTSAAAPAIATARWSQVVAVGVMAAVASASRLLLRTPDAFTQMVWAEDGLLPLCVRKAGFLACTTDSFAGYLMTLPRLLAGVITLLPLPAWPWATNLVATALVGLASATVFAAARRAQRSVPASVLIALLPVAAPIMGFETLGVYASVYTLLVFVLAVVLACQPDGGVWSWRLTTGVAVGLALCALTIPSAIALAVGLIVQILRGRIPRVAGAWLSGALGAGLIVQGLVILTADEQRSTAPTLGALTSLSDALPNALLTLIPGATVGASTVLDFPVLPPTGLGLVLAGVLAGVGIALLWPRSSPTPNAIGILLLTGLVVLAVPTLTGYPNNRYFAAPILVWAAAAVVAMDAWIGQCWQPQRRWVPWAVVGSALAYLWLSAWPVGPLRGTIYPGWSSELDRVTKECQADPNRQVVLQFSPGWPPPSLLLPEPTNPVVLCDGLTLPATQG